VFFNRLAAEDREMLREFLQEAEEDRIFLGADHSLEVRPRHQV
jgi:hypothetical protein